jgi:hypothetical protein
MKIILLAMTVVVMAVAGCATQQDRLEDPSHFPKQDYNGNGPDGHPVNNGDNSWQKGQ